MGEFAANLAERKGKERGGGFLSILFSYGGNGASDTHTHTKGGSGQSMQSHLLIVCMYVCMYVISIHDFLIEIDRIGSRLEELQRPKPCLIHIKYAPAASARRRSNFISYQYISPS